MKILHTKRVWELGEGEGGHRIRVASAIDQLVDAWIRRQVLVGLDSANAGNLSPAGDVESEQSSPSTEGKRWKSLKPNREAFLDA